MVISRNEEFWCWFGESKVVDGAGRPRVVYHGTTKNFLAFSPKRRNPEFGFHFGAISQAEWFATYDPERGTLSGGNIKPAYLRIENPLRVPDIFIRGRESAENLAHWLRREGLFEAADCDEVYRARTASGAHERLACLLNMRGYDGLVYENDQDGLTSTSNEDSYVVFCPTQIKSAFEFGYLTEDRNLARCGMR
jgi:hypothetical protein